MALVSRLVSLMLEVNDNQLRSLVLIFDSKTATTTTTTTATSSKTLPIFRSEGLTKVAEEFVIDKAYLFEDNELILMDEHKKNVNFYVNNFSCIMSIVDSKLTNTLA